MKDKAHAAVDLKEMAIHAISFFMYLLSNLWIMYANSWRFYISNIWYLVVGLL
jgi:hypothetical protein